MYTCVKCTSTVKCTSAAKPTENYYCTIELGQNTKSRFIRSDVGAARKNPTKSEVHDWKDKAGFCTAKEARGNREESTHGMQIRALDKRKTRCQQQGQ